MLAVAVGGGLLTVLYQWYRDRRAERATTDQETDQQTAFRHQHGGTVASSDAATVFAEMGQLLERYKAWLDEAERRAREAESKVHHLQQEVDEVRQHVRDQDEIIRKLQIHCEECEARATRLFQSLREQGIDPT
jgi:chromosome segregation ATPase